MTFMAVCCPSVRIRVHRRVRRIDSRRIIGNRRRDGCLGDGRPSFNALQNHGAGTLVYYAFDVMILAGKGVMSEPLSTRRGLMQEDVLAKLGEPIRESQQRSS
jgi:hypothetical protein